MSKYAYPAILTPETDGGYCVRFPDIDGCFTEGDNLAEALEMAKDALGLMLCAYEDDGDAIPAPTSVADLAPRADEIVSLVSADTIEYRKMYNNKAVKKTLTVPAWLNSIAERNDVNFSYILQKALKEELHISE